NPLFSPAHTAASALARRIGEHLLPRTRAYSEVFLDAEPAQTPLDNEEPLYGRTYLPRKFKIALAVPPRNDVDVFAHDLGFIAIVGEDGVTVGYDVSVGGGMGMTHKVPTTFPRLGDVIGFCEPDAVLAVAEHTLGIQRDFGNRKDRSRARFKYTIEDRGLDWFKAELGKRLGHELAPPRPFVFESSADALGWAQGADGLWHYTLFVENGRVHDRGNVELMSGLRAIASEHDGVFALTTNQNVIIAGVPEEDKARIDGLLDRFRIANARATRLRAGALACVALPTCGLAMAESERYLPTLLDKLDALVVAAGLADEPISSRMSGCPNGCSRPYLAEI